jgi:hypothetical protein
MPSRRNQFLRFLSPEALSPEPLWLVLHLKLRRVWRFLLGPAPPALWLLSVRCKRAVEDMSLGRPQETDTFRRGSEGTRPFLTAAHPGPSWPWRRPGAAAPSSTSGTVSAGAANASVWRPALTTATRSAPVAHSRKASSSHRFHDPSTASEEVCRPRDTGLRRLRSAARRPRASKRAEPGGHASRRAARRTTHCDRQRARMRHLGGKRGAGQARSLRSPIDPPGQRRRTRLAVTVIMATSPTSTVGGRWAR